MWKFLGLSTVAVAAAVDYSQYVNPFVGGAGPYPGLACEYMLRLRTKIDSL